MCFLKKNPACVVFLLFFCLAKPAQADDLFSVNVGTDFLAGQIYKDSPTKASFLNTIDIGLTYYHGYSWGIFAAFSLGFPVGTYATFGRTVPLTKSFAMSFDFTIGPAAHIMVNKSFSLLLGGGLHVKNGFVYATVDTSPFQESVNSLGLAAFTQLMYHFNKDFYFDGYVSLSYDFFSFLSRTVPSVETAQGQNFFASVFLGFGMRIPTT